MSDRHINERVAGQVARKAGRAAMRQMQQRQGKEQDLSAAWRTAAPWVLMVATLVAAPLLRLGALALDATVLGACLFFVSTVVLGGLSWHITRDRRWLGRTHDLVNTVAPMLLITLTIGFGVRTEIMLPGFVLGVTTALLWNKRHTKHAVEAAAAGAGSRSATAAEWEEFTAEHLPQLRGSRLDVLRDDDEQFVAGVKLDEAQVPEDVGNVLQRINRWAGGLRNGTDLIIGDRDDRVLLQVSRKDPLREPFSWKGPNAPGESIMEPIEGLGKYRNGVDLAMLLPHVELKNGPKVVAHMMSVGMTRAGKSAAGEAIDVNICTRRDSAVIFCDAVKADQSVGAIREGAVYILDSAPKIKSFLMRLVTVVIPARTSYLGDPTKNLLGKVCREWEPGCGLTFLEVHVAEGASLYGVEALTQASERAASAGIMLHIEVQRAVHDRIDTNYRSNNSAGLCFGVKDEKDAALALSSELLDLGVNPGAWKNKHPGMCIYEAPGIPDQLLTVPARFGRHAQDGSDIVAALREYMHLAGPLDPITAAALGKPFAEYRAAVDQRLGRRPVQYSFAPAPTTATTPPPTLSRPVTTVLQGSAELPQVPALAVDPQVTNSPDAQMNTNRYYNDQTPAPTRTHGYAHVPDQQGPEDEDLQLTHQQREEAGQDVLAQMESMLGDSADADEAMEGARAGLADPLDDDDAPFVRNPAADIGFPPDPDDLDEARPAPTSRDEAIDILLAVLADQIGEGQEFAPKDLYDAAKKKAGKTDSWVRMTLQTLLAWGCIESSEGRGKYMVVSARRPAHAGHSQ